MGALYCDPSVVKELSLRKGFLSDQPAKYFEWFIFTCRVRGDFKKRRPVDEMTGFVLSRSRDLSDFRSHAGGVGGVAPIL